MIRRCVRSDQPFGRVRAQLLGSAPGMHPRDLLLDGFGRVHDSLRPAVDGLSPDRLAERIAPGANPIGWLVWHLLRVQDDHVADVAGREQVWTAEGWADRFGLDLDVTATGYGFDDAEVDRVRVPSADLLLGYAAAVHARTAEYLRGLSDDDLDRVVDTRWDPPVTLGVRLVSVLSDDLQHVGQAAYVRGALLPT
jgi:uncharacterized damage-inducible protein DinB